jgi:proteasome lid subunit RPN8/RPN11
MEQPNSDPVHLIIPAPVFDSMLAHCLADYPNEACGILAGKDMLVSEIFMMTNTEKSPVSYLMDPEEQFRIMKELRDRSQDMTAVYHSHPVSPAYPSVRDSALAFYEDAFYVIISLAESEPDVKGFSIRNREVREVGISVAPESQM